MVNQDFIKEQIQLLNESANIQDWSENDKVSEGLIDYLEQSGDDQDLQLVTNSLDQMMRVVQESILAELAYRESKVAMYLAVKIFAYQMRLSGWDGNCCLIDFKPKDPAYEDYTDIMANILIGYSCWSKNNILHVLHFFNSNNPEERRAALVFLDGWTHRPENDFSEDISSCLTNAHFEDDIIAQELRSKIFAKLEYFRKK